MLESQKLEFAELVKSSMMIYQQEITTDLLKIWWNCLIGHDLKTVKDAFGRHIQDTKSGKFAPKPADIIAMIELFKPDGRLGADEAWALYPHDEATSAVITEEMAQAMQVAYPLLQEGDKIAARMSFKEAYNRITTQNKINGIQPKWFASLGQDKNGRETVIKEAVRLGRLTQDHAISLLPPAQNSQFNNNVLQLQKVMQIESKIDLTPQEIAKAKEKIAQIKAMLQK